MPANLFNVQAGSVTIGMVVLTQWDDGMAVAGGIFRPNSKFNPHEHATELNGINLAQQARLSLSSDDGKLLICELVTLVDWSRDAGEGGREIVAFGVADGGFIGGN